MALAGEIAYYGEIGESGRQHAQNKPFSEAAPGLALLEVGAVLSLLPPPPARILECGCGTGWFTLILQKCGYEAVGMDVCADAIELARCNNLFGAGVAPEFLVGEGERMTFDAEFDAVVFFDSLHHSLDEQQVLRNVYRALKPGGRVVASEPGVGHHKNSLDVVARFNVTEKDMPPKYVVRLGKNAGFRSHRIYPHALNLGRLVYERENRKSWKGLLLCVFPLRHLACLWMMMFKKRNVGITVLYK